MSVHADPPPAIVREPKGLQYITGSQLGKGGFAICHRADLCVDMKPTGKTVALKIVRSKMEPAKLAQKFVTELQLHSKLHHPNIVEFYRAFSFETSTYVVLELCDNGSLADALRKRAYFTMPEIRRWLVQICGAVKYLHHRNIVHRDLKTGNLFLDKGMNIKVGDFGLAAVLVSKHDIGMRRTTMCGTPNYLAPEILEKGGRGHNEKVDLWAIGIIAYTLAVGKAPFHASKREDIYKKLQNREYKWPDVSKTQNDISTDLRDLVSSLLVHEDDRPSPDEIVSHAFFKTKFIPDQLPSGCVTKKPNWPNIQPPSSETLRRGYSESWMKLCKESGVGIYAPGKTFPLSNSKRIVSVVKDCEKEIAAGRAPVVPIPEDQVYLPFPERINILEARIDSLSEIVEERESSAEGLQLTEISANKQSSKSSSQAPRAQARRHKENMDPVEEEAADARSPPVKRKNSTRKKQEVVMPWSSRRTSGERIPRQRIASIRQVSREEEAERPTSSRQTSREQQIEERVKPSRLPSREIPAVDEHQEPIKPVRKVSAEQLVEHRPKVARLTSREQPGGEQTMPSRHTSRDQGMEDRRIPSRQTSREQPVEDTPMLARKPSRRERHVMPPAMSTEARTRQELRDPPSALPRTMSAPVIDGSIRRLKTVRAVSASEEPIPEKKPQVEVVVIPDDTPPSPETPCENPLYTDPVVVLARAAQLRDNIASALSGKNSVGRRDVTRPNLPFVSKWVDYARKHGVGYVTADGSIGCLFTATSRHPVTPAIVRHGYPHLQGCGKQLEGVSKVPLEYYTQRAGDVLKREDIAGDRKRVTAILWAKFGKYMCQQLGDAPAQKDEYPWNQTVFVRYYQRLGPVSIWGFSDGCFQFNFPDHTKLVISADGKYADFTSLTIEAMAHLQEHGELPMKFIRGREVRSGPISQLLYGKELAETMEANLLREKLLYVNDVVGQWLTGGGLGCSAATEGARRVKWNGPRLEDGKKEEWLTVGRFGGDAVPE